MQYGLLVVMLMLLSTSGCSDPMSSQRASVDEVEPSAPIDYDAMAFEMQEQAASYTYQGKFDRAIEEINKAIRIDPKNAELCLTRGVIYRKQGKYDLALDDVNRAIRLRPDFAIAFCQRGFVYRQSTLNPYGKKALADADRAIKLDPSITLAYIVRGGALVDGGDAKSAIADYTKAIEQNPQSSAAYGGRAVAYVLLEEYEKAQSDIDMALSLNPVPSDRNSIEQLQTSLNAFRREASATQKDSASGSEHPQPAHKDVNIAP